MEKLCFLQPSEEQKTDALAFCADFYENGETVINGSGGLDFFPEYETWLAYLRGIESGEEEGFVPSHVWFAADEKGRLVGIIDIRPRLPAEKMKYGHIGYAVAPTYRRRGYARQMLHWAVDALHKYGVGRIRVAGYEENVASRRLLETSGFKQIGSYSEEASGKTVLEYEM